MSVREPHVLVDARFKAQQRGGDRCRFELARWLSEQRVSRYTFLTYRDTDAILRSRAAGAQTICTRCKPNQHPRGDLFEHFYLPLLTKKLRADLYHGTFNVLPFMPGAPLTVLTIHDMAVFAHPEAYSRKFAAYGRVTVRHGIKRATHIITVSQATAREVVKYVPEAQGKITTILNGVGEEFIAARQSAREAIEGAIARLDIPKPYVLFVGNLERKKNLPRLMEAFQLARSTHNLPHSLVIVGEKLIKGPEVGIDEKNLRNVHFTGYIEDADLPLLYRGADLAAYPSIYEGFGMPVLEAMAAGVPVLTSKVSSLPEVAGDAGILVDPFDVRDIANGLHRALTDPGWRSHAIQAGMERARLLSWSANASQTSDVYQMLWKRACSGG